MKPLDRRAWFLAGAFTLIFVTFYGAASALSGLVPWRIHVDFGFEQAIPYVSAAAWIYLSMNFLLVLAPLTIGWRKMVPMFVALTLQTVLGALCFVVLPVETSFPVRADATMAFAIADTINLERNFLPSLHVAFAVTGALAFGRDRGLLARFVVGGWALGIAASTMLIHEHHLLDVVAGAALAVGTWMVALRREERLVDAFDVELLCYENFYAFARRHRRYALIGVALTAQSLGRWRKRRVLRTGFAFLQVVDDLLDGDRACEGEPLDVVQSLLEQLEGAEFGDEPLDRLARAFHEDLGRAGGPHALAQAAQLIRVMQRDRQRVLDQCALPESEMRAQLRETFALSVDLMLTAGGAELRSDDAPALLDAFAWCSTMRDLEEDLQKGLYLVPREVVEQAVAEGASLADPSSRFQELLGTDAVRSWMHREYQAAQRALDATDELLSVLEGRAGHRALRMFARSIRTYAGTRYVSAFGLLPEPQERAAVWRTETP